MPADEARVALIRKALSDAKLDALVCTVPGNVLMLSGYWPVIGNSIAIATEEGAVGLLVPEDERDLARNSRANEIRTFQAGSLEELKSIAECVCEPLRELAERLGLRSGAVLGYEGSSFDPVSYASNFIYGAESETILDAIFPKSRRTIASEVVQRLRSVLTAKEVPAVRRACALARLAFLETAAGFEAGMREFEIARSLRSRLFAPPGDGERSGGFAYCMSGPNSAEAYAAYQHSRSRAIEAGDFILVHCNSYYGGFWTDITRTFCAGTPDARKLEIMDAVLEASRAAVAAVRPGVGTAAIDRAAREVLEKRGFGKAFRHATGHGVGFSAVNHNARPRIHPVSDEILEAGMVFNIEPAVYLEGYGGMRHCSMVLVTEDGCEPLTPFLDRRETLSL